MTAKQETRSKLSEGREIHGGMILKWKENLGD